MELNLWRKKTKNIKVYRGTAKWQRARRHTTGEPRIEIEGSPENLKFYARISPDEPLDSFIKALLHEIGPRAERIGMDLDSHEMPLGREREGHDQGSKSKPTNRLSRPFFLLCSLVIYLPRPPFLFSMPKSLTCQKVDSRL